MNSARIGLACLLASSLAPCAAQAQDYPAALTTYYLHSGSTYQEGCWGPCACVLSNREPMHGAFRMALANIGDVTDFYVIDGVDWQVPRLAGAPFNLRLTGTGRFLAGQEPHAQHQVMDLDLTLNPPRLGGPAMRAFSSEHGERTAPPPVIRVDIADSTTGCPGVRMQIVATFLRSDWNADARSSVQDLFDYLASYFTPGTWGDYTGDGEVSVGDVFAFLADWFAGA